MKIKTDECYFCGKGVVEKHHISYRTPPIKIPLCEKCHNKFHYVIKDYQKLINQRDIQLHRIAEILCVTQVEDLEFKRILAGYLSKDKKVKIPLTFNPEIIKIIETTPKKSEKVKLIAKELSISDRHARRIYNKLEGKKDE